MGPWVLWQQLYAVTDCGMRLVISVSLFYHFLVLVILKPKKFNCSTFPLSKKV